MRPGPDWLRRAEYHEEHDTRPDPMVAVLWLMWIAIGLIAVAWWGGFIG
jgi:hypothetical protein